MLDLLQRLTRRDHVRTEANIQADVRQLLVSAPLQLSDGDLENVILESPLGDRRRIDVEVGSAVIEVKRDLRKGNVRVEAIDQLAGYVATRAQQTRRRYVGVLTDGSEWCCYDLRDNKLEEVTKIVVGEGDAELGRLLFWLEGVLATARGITPSANEIAARLGAGSSSHQLDSASLRAIYKRHAADPSIQMKRGLWSKLLTSTLGTQFADTDDLFIEHTLLVNSAEIISHALLGLDVDAIGPTKLLAGDAFEESGIYGVVEEDFFDWIVEVEEGVAFVRSLARRLSRFEWKSVDQDVLKVLYESVIGAETRKRLGEYYTPDWLASLVVDAVIDAPLTTRALDPACGSGTFLFQAVRRHLAAAEAAGMSTGDQIRSVTKHVIGMDLHPVAVTFARVTYLLAIGQRLLTDPSRGTVFVPVYLGDSMQWNSQNTSLFNADNLVVPVSDRADLFAPELRFPDRLLEDARMFDDLVEGMADLASRRAAGDRIPSLGPLFQRLGVPQGVRSTVEATFKVLCGLHDQKRDHIWSYFVRNLARPMWLARAPNRVDALIGNPPWLAYRHMPTTMQATFRDLSDERGLWHGKEIATHQDLSALFVARTIELYLKDGGRFGMVMPNAVVDRDHYAGFRTGSFDASRSITRAAFDESWDLRRIRPHFFPRGSSVVFGRRAAIARSMPSGAEVFSGTLPRGSRTTIEHVLPHLIREHGAVEVASDAKTISPYAERFRQGAILAPRLFFFVERRASGSLGIAAGRQPVISQRSVNEKPPWKSLPDVAGVVESQFLRPLYSGETLLPFRNAEPLTALLPVDAGKLLRTQEQIEVYPGLAEWWRKCEKLWVAHRTSERLSLFEQLDYMSKLSGQFPTPPLRVIYNTSGMHLAAARLEDPRGVVSNNLYWCTASSEEEADYLCAILNSPATTERVRPLMSYGKDERHVHKHVWKLRIAEFDQSNISHMRLAMLGRELALVAAGVAVDAQKHFAASRRNL